MYIHRPEKDLSIAENFLRLLRPDTKFTELEARAVSYTHLDVYKRQINKWADKGKFTVIKVGSRVRIRRDEFEDWMEQRDLERSMQ